MTKINNIVYSFWPIWRKRFYYTRNWILFLDKIKNCFDDLCFTTIMNIILYPRNYIMHISMKSTRIASIISLYCVFNVDFIFVNAL